MLHGGFEAQSLWQAMGGEEGRKGKKEFEPVHDASLPELWAGGKRGAMMMRDDLRPPRPENARFSPAGGDELREEEVGWGTRIRT